MTTTTLPQGDLRLLDTDLAQRMLASTELARLAYVAPDGTPRVLPMLFHWTGDELVMATFAGTAKLPALRADPAVAVTIDRAGPPPEVLLLRGNAVVTEVDGVLPEYAAAQRRYYGPEQAAASVAEVDRPGLRMARIAVRPSWVGTFDFQERFPGGRTAEDFARRGR
ncbi:pyridoxamine 5'-phosphate oxidase family protein [Amycolatopsis tucumanensis]|uniref:pyridoxamine 5'-phosphate oxidase family protein n=1 Tax=Amycolatopsis tucumanensis TaxID=401106 RepID=UPI003D70DFCA